MLLYAALRPDVLPAPDQVTGKPPVTAIISAVM